MIDEVVFLRTLCLIILGCAWIANYFKRLIIEECLSENNKLRQQLRDANKGYLVETKRSTNYTVQSEQAHSQYVRRRVELLTFFKDKDSSFTSMHGEYTFDIADHEREEVTAYLKHNKWIV